MKTDDFVFTQRKVHKIINKLLTKDYFDCTFLHFVQKYNLENGKKERKFGETFIIVF